MGRDSLHKTNTVFVGIIMFIFLFLSLGAVFFASQNGFNTSSIFSSQSGGIIVLILTLISIAYFVFLLYSFNTKELKNNFFKWADWINLTNISLSILIVVIMTIYLASVGPSVSLIDKLNSYLRVLTFAGGIIYVASFIVFMVGYIFGNKKN